MVEGSGSSRKGEMETRISEVWEQGGLKETEWWDGVAGGNEKSWLWEDQGSAQACAGVGVTGRTQRLC